MSPGSDVARVTAKSRDVWETGTDVAVRERGGS